MIDDERALIQTTDFFPPVCSDPYTFGSIAAANALSDVYAMGGTALTALNIVCFPSGKIPLEVLAGILSGGQDKVTEANALIVGGHTIDDFPPKYGLAVTGIVHPGRVVTNAAAKAGDTLILTKPLGTGIVMAGERLHAIPNRQYEAALASMQQLNRGGAEVMRRHSVKSATDITGFGLLGHAANMAKASGVTFRIAGAEVPLLEGVYELANSGCFPGACFRNREFVLPRLRVREGLDYNLKMIMLDAQTSGGLFMCIPREIDPAVVLDDLRREGYPHAKIIGEAVPQEDAEVILE